MTRLEIATRIKNIREELESRHKTGVVKMSTASGNPITTKALQDEMFALIYKLSKME